jgi:hypothetical protein
MESSSLAPHAHTRLCPHCDSHYVARSHRQGIWGLPLLRFLGVRRFRCTNCWQRFVGFSRR